MKTILVLIIVLLFICIKVLLFNTSELPVPASERQATKDDNTGHQYTQSNNSWLDRFYIGAVDEDYDYRNNYLHLNQLGFNLWHTYLGEDNSNPNRAYPQMLWSGRYKGDKLMDSVESYSSTVNDYINQIYGAGEIKLIMMRPKIEWLCYGQRSDYKCNDNLETQDEQELWFYHFQESGHTTGSNIRDNSSFGNGVKVRYCSIIPSSGDSPGLVVSRLKTNTEQCHSVDPQGGNQWRCDSQCDWIIKPRIRIPKDFPNSHPETPVCKITVLKQDGKTVLKEVIITGKYFGSNQNPYNGNYIEDTYHFPIDTNLTIHGDWGNIWVYSARGNHNPDGIGDNHSDIQVYWYGNCDMWIDYVRVDNDVADQLFKRQWDNRITQEVTQIGVGKIMKYYLELVEFNNLPCMAYVNSRLKQSSGGSADLVQDLTNTISVHVPWENVTSIENPTFLNNQYIQKVGFTQVFAESYPMTACFTTNANQQGFSNIPNTLPVTSGDNVLAQSVSPSTYDTWLQDNINHKPYLLEPGGGNAIYCGITSCGGTSGSGYLHQDNGNFRNRMQLCDSISKLANIPFIFMPQAHQWFLPGEVRREPTNEELNMIANVGVSYGVKGLIYFSFYSWSENNCRYGTGISIPNETTLRTGNYYGEVNPNKEQTFQGIVNRLSNKWGPYLLSFNNENRHSYIYDDPVERNKLIANSYFSDVYSYIPLPSDHSLPNTTAEDPSIRYLQVGTFINPNEMDSKYFMIVNRRCSPFYNINGEYGGGRYVNIQFDANASAFNGFDNWKIINVYNDSTVQTFNKNNSGLLHLGWYMPGEGKLYKIVPVQ